MNFPKAARAATVAITVLVSTLLSTPTSALEPEADYPEIWELSATMTETHSTMVRLYWAVFDRVPDVGGVTFWRDGIDSCEWTLPRIAAFFEQSEEFSETYGDIDDRNFIREVYLNVFEREPDAGGWQFWIDELARGVSRGDAILRMSASPEFVSSHRLQSDSTPDRHCQALGKGDVVGGQPLSAGDDYDCDDFASQAAAQEHHDADIALNGRDTNRLDQDGNGIACEATDTTTTPPDPDPGPGTVVGGQPLTAGDTYNCSDFPTQAAATAHLQADLQVFGRDTNNLDRDGNGQACEGLP